MACEGMKSVKVPSAVCWLLCWLRIVRNQVIWHKVLICFLMSKKQLLRGLEILFVKCILCMHSEWTPHRWCQLPLVSSPHFKSYVLKQSIFPNDQATHMVEGDFTFCPKLRLTFTFWEALVFHIYICKIT